MGVDVVDGLFRPCSVPDHLAVEVDRIAPGRHPIGRPYFEGGEIAGQPNADDVRVRAQHGGVSPGHAIGIGEQAVSESLCVILLIGLGTVDGIAQSIVEGADSRAGEFSLKRRYKA